MTQSRASRFGLDGNGLKATREVSWNLNPSELIEHAIRNNEGRLTRYGCFAAVTSPHTGRSPKDKFVVKESATEAKVDWGVVNQPLDPEKFALLKADVLKFLGDQNLYVQDLYAGADPKYRLNVRTISTNAWQTLFARNMFIRPSLDEAMKMEPQFTILHAPEFQADPARHGTRTSTAICVSFEHKVILIAGTRYAGEIKKSIFGIMNFLLPDQGILSMHCSANVGKAGDTALFFGLSGTGKTTLSADPDRSLIGDDEHGWSADGVFNFEGGCYAKVINLSAATEPDIFRTTQMYATVLENVVLDDNREVDYASTEITENTRASYPLESIENTAPGSRGGHPKNIVFLTADAFGVLPPISKLTRDQAMYYFLSGYTAKVAGTERGVTEPQATFSACFGGVFLAWHPGVYAQLLGEQLDKHGANVWLVNTGWTGGAYGTGSRMKLSHTRSMINAVLDGRLASVKFETDPVFGLSIPTSCPDVANEVLNPRNTWKDGAAYDEQAKKLAEMFKKNFERFAAGVKPEVKAAGPK